MFLHQFLLSLLYHSQNNKQMIENQAIKLLLEYPICLGIVMYILTKIFMLWDERKETMQEEYKKTMLYQQNRIQINSLKTQLSEAETRNITLQEHLVVLERKNKQNYPSHTQRKIRETRKISTYPGQLDITFDEFLSGELFSINDNREPDLYFRADYPKNIFQKHPTDPNPIRDSRVADILTFDKTQEFVYIDFNIMGKRIYETSFLALTFSEKIS